MSNILAKKERLVNEAKKRIKEHEELDKLKSKLKHAEIMYDGTNPCIIAFRSICIVELQGKDRKSQMI